MANGMDINEMRRMRRMNENARNAEASQRYRKQSSVSSLGSSRNTGHSTLNTGLISRGGFMRGAGIAAGSALAAGLGLGGIAKATVGLETNQSKCLAADPDLHPSWDPVNQSCGCTVQVMSVMSEISSADKLAFKHVFEYPGDLYQIGNHSICIPKPLPVPFASNPQNVDPVFDFTDEAMAEMWNNVKYTMINIPGVGAVPLFQLVYMAIADFRGRFGSPVTDISQMMKPIDFESWEYPELLEIDEYGNPTYGNMITVEEPEFASLNPLTYLVEFEVPASQMEKMDFAHLLNSNLPEWFCLACPNFNCTGIDPSPSMEDCQDDPSGQKCACYFCSLCPDPSIKKLRGWYIQGRGVDNGAGNLKRGLVIYHDGLAAFKHRKVDVLMDYGINYCRGSRKLVAQMALDGWDVLYMDKRGRGDSEGGRWFDNKDIFYILELLGNGSVPDKDESESDIERKFRYLKAGDQRNAPSPGTPVEGQPFPWFNPANIKQFPVIVAGISEASLFVGTTMTLNYETDLVVGGTPANPITEYNPLAEPYNRYNLIGALLMDSLTMPRYILGDSVIGPFSMTYSTYWLMCAATRTDTYIRNAPMGELLASIHKWPGICRIQCINDIWLPHGAIEEYNRARGCKEIVLEFGQHAMSVYPPNLDYTIYRALKWARRAMHSPGSLNNAGQTTLANELLKSPAVGPTAPVGAYYWPPSPDLDPWDFIGSPVEVAGKILRRDYERYLG